MYLKTLKKSFIVHIAENINISGKNYFIKITFSKKKVALTFPADGNVFAFLGARSPGEVHFLTLFLVYRDGSMFRQ